jgi:predicted tellurium resistance membrane protein TerC
MPMFELLMDPHTWVALATLTALEIVLGIDNIVFISILAGKLPPEDRDRARKIGLIAALVSRLLLLLTLAWLAKLTAPLFTLVGHELSGRDLVLIVGGLFLIYKATHEIHEKLEGPQGNAVAAVAPTFAAVIGQIMIIDIVFSLDSIVTAVGMVDHIAIMVAAIVISVGFMLLFSGPISEFVNRHPTVKMLALGFLMIIGIALIADGLDFHIPKGYIYGAMAFAVFIETLNLRSAKKSPPVHLHETFEPADARCPTCGQALAPPVPKA